MIAGSNKSQESRISKIVLDNPLKSILIPIFLTFILGFGLRFIIVDDNMMAMLPTKMESRTTWDAVQNEFGSTGVVGLWFVVDVVNCGEFNTISRSFAVRFVR